MIELLYVIVIVLAVGCYALGRAIERDERARRR
jgi:hypothetical protein